MARRKTVVAVKSNRQYSRGFFEVWWTERLCVFFCEDTTRHTLSWGLQAKESDRPAQQKGFPGGRARKPGAHCERQGDWWKTDRGGNGEEENILEELITLEYNWLCLGKPCKLYKGETTALQHNGRKGGGVQWWLRTVIFSCLWPVGEVTCFFSSTTCFPRVTTVSKSASNPS